MKESLLFMVLMLLTLTQISSAFAISNYESCADILQMPPTDTIDSSSTLNRDIAIHSEFCRIAKQFNLNEINYDNFSKQYAKKTSSSSGKARASVLDIFGGSASGSHGTDNETEHLNQLKENKKNILDYYNSNCGNLSYEEFLQHEAMAKQKIVQPSVSDNWLKCMVDSSKGLYAFVAKHDYEEGNNQYSVVVGWKTNVDVEVIKMIITYNKRLISSLDDISSGSFSSMVPRKNTDEVTFLFESLNNNQQQYINFNAEISSGDFKTASITIPRKIPQIIKPIIAPFPAKPSELELKMKKFHYYLELLLQWAWIDAKDYLLFKEANDVPIFGATKDDFSALDIYNTNTKDLNALIWRFNPNFSEHDLD